MTKAKEILIANIKKGGSEYIVVRTHLMNYLYLCKDYNLYFIASSKLLENIDKIIKSDIKFEGVKDVKIGHINDTIIFKHSNSDVQYDYYGEICEFSSFEGMFKRFYKKCELF